MKTLILSAVAAVGLALGTTQTASAGWVTRTAYRWDPYCCRYVACTERVWADDCHDPCGPSYYGARDYYGGRDYYDPGYYRDRSFSLDFHIGRDRHYHPYRR